MDTKYICRYSTCIGQEVLSHLRNNADLLTCPNILSHRPPCRTTVLEDELPNVQLAPCPFT